MSSQPTTIFSLEGSLHEFPGSMLELHTAVDSAQWNHLVLEAIQHLAFLNCLKEVAFPLLDEHWTTQDEHFRKELERSVARMRNIDPLLMVAAEQKLPGGTISGLQEQYAARMREGAKDIQQMIDRIRAELGTDNITITPVSEL